ncbi:MAG: leucyl/phenylalanyl-tRNA--protein transferase [Acidobacteria bacterium]|nr:leucyl/phenylalanyl-tRNA--protein transferase [Acidobacteriota bacterium]
MIPFLAAGARFPPAGRALREPNGLLAAGGDLSVPTLLEAYTHGIFPWFSEGDPILWWSPDPRMVLPTTEMHLSRSLRRRLRRRDFRVSFDEAFEEVLRACAKPREPGGGTWLVPEMQAAYTALRDHGYAHSVEVWLDGRLAGGLYGVGIGRMFFGESMFSRRTDGSKIAIACLAAQMAAWGMPLIDCQMATGHLESLGARLLPRRVFLAWVSALCAEPGPGAWRFDEGLDPAAALARASEEAARS